jgi:hypothetical protein
MFNRIVVQKALKQSLVMESYPGLVHYKPDNDQEEYSDLYLKFIRAYEEVVGLEK